MCVAYTKVSCLQELTVGRRQEDKNDPHSGSLLVFLIVVPNFHLFRQLQASRGQVLPAPPLHRLGVKPYASLTPPRTFQRIRVGSWSPHPHPLSGLTLATQRSGERAQRLDIHLAVEIACVQGCLVTLNT